MPSATPMSRRGSLADPAAGPALADPLSPDIEAAEPTAVAGHRIGRAAALIAAITVLSRLVGFARTLVLGSVAGGNSRITTAYLTANTVPNVIFEIVAGGALAALVVPLVAAAISRADTASVSRTGSALMTWVLTILIPVGGLVALFAHPIVALLVPRGSLTTAQLDQTVNAGVEMLRIFAIQIPLYGVGIVLGGLLQAHRRFAWPVIAPLLSSVVVIATYVAYGLVVAPNADLPDVGQSGQLILAVGTTLGVVALSCCLVIPTRRMGLRLRPTYAFEPDVRSKVAGLAWVGVITVAAQQLSFLLAVALSNGGPPGGYYAYTLAWTIYLVPWSVLTVPVATSVYPTLATAFATGDEPAYHRALSNAARSVLLLSALGAAGLIAAATPMTRVFDATTHHTIDVGTVAAAIATFAPGLIGYGLFALFSRALYARHQNRFAAVSTLIGWGAVAIASLALSAALPRRLRVEGLTIANSIGMTVLAVTLLVMIGRRTGTASLQGCLRAGLAAVIGGAAAAAAGVAARLPLSGRPGVVGDIGQGILSGVVALIVFCAVAIVIDRRDVRPLVTRLAPMPGRGRRRAADRRE